MADKIDTPVLLEAYGKRIARLERLQITAHLGSNTVQADMVDVKRDVRSLLDDRIANTAILKSIRVLVAAVPIVVSAIVWLLSRIH